MSTGTKIEWTDATWNPVRGCTKISPGCAHCYAETFRYEQIPSTGTVAAPPADEVARPVSAEIDTP